MSPHFAAVLAAVMAGLGGTVPPATAETIDTPRLAGIVVEGDVKVAIFAGPGDRNSQAVREGDALGEFTVTAITRSDVRLAAPVGDVLVRPSPNLGSRSVGLLQAIHAPLIDPTYREAVTETDQ